MKTLLAAYPALLSADDKAPWGSAAVLDIDYKLQKVLYNLVSDNPDKLANVLDRVGYLYQITSSDPLESSIAVGIHGDAIPLFAIGEWKRFRELMMHAQSLIVGTTIEFRMCQAAARMMKYQPADIHGFVQIAPMANAEIVRLQQEGYAYMQ